MVVGISPHATRNFPKLSHGSFRRSLKTKEPPNDLESTELSAGGRVEYQSFLKVNSANRKSLKPTSPRTNAALCFSFCLVLEILAISLEFATVKRFLMLS